MPKHKLPIPQIPDIATTEMGGANVQLLSSDERGWQGIAARLYQTTDQPTFVTVPVELVTQVHTIALNTCGSVKVGIRAAGRTHEYVSSVGDIAILPHNFDGASCWVGSAHLLHIHLTPTLLVQVADEVSGTDPARIQFNLQFDLRDLLLQQIGLALMSELQVDGFGGRLYAEALGTTVALHLLRNYSTLATARTLPVRGLAPPLLRSALDYLHAHLAQDVPLATLAATTGLSPSYFLRQFKASTGLAPHQYLIQQRVERARLLLLGGQHSIAAIAQAVGFADQSHLHRHFKRAFGVSPRAVLQKRKNVPD